MRHRSSCNRIAGAAALAALLLWMAPAGARADEPNPEAAAAATDSTAKEAPKKGKALAEGKAKQATKKTAKADAKTAAKETAMPGTMPVKPSVAPQHVQVQHILIGFTGSVPGKNILRTKEQAKTLAYEILERARKGEDFDALVRKYTDDSPPGIYGMHEVGVAPGPNEYARNGMVPAFGNVGFNISPGNIGIADYDKGTSPYGWHVIKRLK